MTGITGAVLQERSTVLVTTCGSIILITDASAVVNTQEFWDYWETAQRRLAVEELRRHERLVAIEVLVDGVFRIDFGETRTPVGATENHLLDLPSGQLVLVTTGPVQPVLLLPPDRYSVTIGWSVSEESKHYGLTSPEAYPPLDGPDGTILLVRRFS